MWQIIIANVVWVSLGLCLDRFNVLSTSFPKQLGKTLYWIGMPIQIFGLALTANFADAVWLPPTVTIVVLLSGLAIAVLCLYLGIKFLRQKSLTKKSEQGSFVLASILGNTGFVGLSIVPILVDKAHLSSILLYGITHNIVGSYGIGVVLASHFGRNSTHNKWWNYCQTILKTPALWAFALGCIFQQSLLVKVLAPTVKMLSIWVIPGVFLLLGMQLAQIRTKNLSSAFLPTAIKTIVLPALTGIILTYLGVRGEIRLGLVLMSGMPTAFANAILAEEYNLDRQLTTSSILVGTLFLPLSIPLWLFFFGAN
jgi:malate permease and related proteins